MNALIHDDAFEGGFTHEPKSFVFDGRPLIVQGTGVFIGTNRETQQATQVLVDVFNGFDNLNEVKLVDGLVECVATVPALDGTDQSTLGQQSHQAPQIFVGDVQLFHQEFCRNQLMLLHGHETHYPDGVTRCIGQIHCLYSNFGSKDKQFF